MLLVAGCATGGGGGGDEIDARITTGADAPINLMPDAPISTIDAGTGCSQVPCDITPQCGCAAGEACDLDPANFGTAGTLCRGAGSGTTGTICTADENCAAGYGCVGFGGGSSCTEYCNGDGDCAGGGSICAITLVYGTPSMPVPGITMCSTDCQPPVPGGNCPAGWGCHMAQEQGGLMRNFTICSAAGAGGQQATCTYNSDCQAGYSCYTDGTSFFCLHNCVYPAGTGCPAGTTCNQFATPAIIGGVNYGYCF
jgi:hypothetical protein